MIVIVKKKYKNENKILIQYYSKFILDFFIFSFYRKLHWIVY